MATQVIEFKITLLNGQEQTREVFQFHLNKDEIKQFLGLSYLEIFEILNNSLISKLNPVLDDHTKTVGEVHVNQQAAPDPVKEETIHLTPNQIIELKLAGIISDSHACSLLVMAGYKL